MFTYYDETKVETLKPVFANTLDELINTYNTWIAQQGLPDMSADELAWEDCVNDEQRDWLVGFSEQWEALAEEKIQ